MGMQVWKTGMVVLLAAPLGCNRFKSGEACEDPPDYFDPGHVLQVEIDMEASDWDELRMQSRSFIGEFAGDCREQPFLNDYTVFSADVTIDGESASNIGIRKKGFIGSQSTIKPSLKLHVDNYEPGQALHCNDNITFNNAVQDPAIIRQCLAYDLFAQAGLPASRCNFARVSLNGDDLGIYAHVEPVKRRFLRRHFGNDNGDLYEGTLSDFDLAKYRTFEPKNDDTDTTLSRIKALSEDLKDYDGTLREALAAHIDVEQFIDFWAMEVIVGHWDGYSGNLNNFYIYRNPDTDRFVFIPWGMDGTLDPAALGGDDFDKDEGGRGVFSLSMIPHLMIQDDELSALFYERLDALLEEVWEPEAILAEIDRMEAMLAGEIDTSVLEDALDGVRTYVKGRKAQLQSSVPATAEPLRDPFCLREVGTLDAEFETTWGSNESDELTTTGEVSITLVWEGEELEYVTAGAGIGPADDAEEDSGFGALILALLLDEQIYAHLWPYLYFDSEMAAAGQSIPIDGVSAGGSAWYTDANMDFQIVEAAMLHSGSLSFDQYSEVDGDVVSGQLSTSLYNWE